MIYNFLYCYLYKLFNAFSEGEDGFNAWRPLLAINIFKVIILLQTFNYYTINTGQVINIGKRHVLIIIIVSLLLVVPDYILFINNAKWKILLELYNTKSKRQKLIMNLSYTIMVFGAIGSLFYSFVLMARS